VIGCVADRCAIKHDVVTVRDGSSRDSVVMATYCGANVTSRPAIVSTGDTALVEFVSDQRDQRQGFAASFQFLVADKDLSVGHVTQATPPVPTSRLRLHPPPSASAFGNFRRA